MRVKQIVEDPSQELFLSSVSLWKMAIKLRSGRLDIGGRSATDVLVEARNMNLHLISLDPNEASTHGSLTEDSHFDPIRPHACLASDTAGYDIGQQRSRIR